MTVLATDGRNTPADGIYNTIGSSITHPFLFVQANKYRGGRLFQIHRVKRWTVK